MPSPGCLQVTNTADVFFIYWHFPQHSEQSLSPFKEGICVGGKWLSAHSQVEMGIQSQANETTVTDTRGQSLTSRCVQRIITGMGSGRDRAGCRRMGNNHRGSSSLPCPALRASVCTTPRQGLTRDLPNCKFCSVWSEEMQNPQKSPNACDFLGIRA